MTILEPTSGHDKEQMVMTMVNLLIMHTTTGVEQVQALQKSQITGIQIKTMQQLV
jgi:hypothetical protein